MDPAPTTQIFIFATVQNSARTPRASKFSKTRIGARPASAQNMIFARKSPVVTATTVATTPGIMKE